MPSVVTDPRGVTSRPTVWRIGDRRTFAALRRDGRRARAGGITITWLAPPPGPATPPRVAFAVARAAGGAVQRNRIRRRLRAALRELVVTDRLPAGAYLVGAGAEVATVAWPELVATLADAVGRAAADGR